MENFLVENKEVLLCTLTFFIGLVLPNPKINMFGLKIGSALPEKIKKEIADKIDAFEQGLRGKSYEGDSNIISNDQLNEETQKLKKDLGL